MSRILNRRKLTTKIFELTIETPRIARKAQPGQFVVVMADETGERIPLTIADFDRESGTVTLVVMVVGASTLKLSRLEVGDRLFAVIGPLGKSSEIEKLDAVAMVAGGVGAACSFAGRTPGQHCPGAGARQPADSHSQAERQPGGCGLYRQGQGRKPGPPSDQE